MDINKAMKISMSNGFRIYPEPLDGLFVIAIKDQTGCVKLYSKKFSTKTINMAIHSTWIYVANLIKNKNNERQNN